MATQTLAATGPTQAEATPAAALQTLRHPVAMGLASAVLLALAFPGQEADGWSGLAWFALAPLFGLVRSGRSRRSLYLGAWLGGFAFWLASIRWVTWSDETAWLGWLVMALALSAWWPAFLGLSRLAVRRFGLPLMVAAPVTWVALEFIQGYAFTGFSWYYLAHTQYRVLPVIQIADFAGAWGPSFLLAMANAWWVELVAGPRLRATPRGLRPTRPQVVRAATLAAALLATLAYGGYRLATGRFRPGPTLALLQSDMKQEYKARRTEGEVQAVYERLAAIALRDRPDLIVWPETSWPLPIPTIDPALSEADLDRLVRARYPKDTAASYRLYARAVTDHLHKMVDSARTPMLLGSLSYEFRPGGLSRYNSAVLIAPRTASVRSYHKLHLVPFGEYVPLIEMFPWLTVLTPYRGETIPSLAFGTEAVGFDLAGLRYATVICFEDTVPRIARRFFAEAGRGRQPDVLLNQSNDGWFRGSAEPDMHLAISVFRAIENRVPLARAANTGISALIDGDGRIRQTLAKCQEGVLTVKVLLDDRVSLYSAWGDWFPGGCLAATFGLVVAGVVRSIQERRQIRQTARLAQVPSVR